jgi:hypothetical protein
MVATEAAITVYKGYRGGATDHLVTKNDDILMPGPSQKLWNHSPDGFSWGYSGSGPAQLALAILLDVTGDEGLASRHHQAFKFKYVAGWGDRWEITSEQVLAWLNGTVDGILRT